mmetsp:Transcript_28845/g.92091  ORF Transcript_28845/g.92091 Transcript_28845/m.92091 type:complete len:255 (+) Transcript_28845:2724-3488(+)
MQSQLLLQPQQHLLEYALHVVFHTGDLCVDLFEYAEDMKLLDRKHEPEHVARALLVQQRSHLPRVELFVIEPERVADERRLLLARHGRQDDLLDPENFHRAQYPQRIKHWTGVNREDDGDVGHVEWEPLPEAQHAPLVFELVDGIEYEEELALPCHRLDVLVPRQQEVPVVRGERGLEEARVEVLLELPDQALDAFVEAGRPRRNPCEVEEYRRGVPEVMHALRRVLRHACTLPRPRRPRHDHYVGAPRVLASK